MKYAIVQATNINALANMVNLEIQQGWSPLGGVCISAIFEPTPNAAGNAQQPWLTGKFDPANSTVVLYQTVMPVSHFCQAMTHA
jgi:hypothetical protein